MERESSKSKNKILKFLPKAAQAAVSFKNPPFSPGHDKRPDIVNSYKLKTHMSKGFSGSIVSMIPAEARRKSKNLEPTSPKVSCMGQIKHKPKICRKKQASQPKEFKPEKKRETQPPGPGLKLKKKPSGIQRIFGAGRKSDASNDQDKPPLPDRAPSLSQMRKFASSRDTFANFDWTTAQIAPEEDRYSDSDEDRGYSDGEDEVIIPFSEPILVAGAGAGSRLALEPRKEINLWKRRTMSQPKPLQLNIVRGK